LPNERHSAGQVDLVRAEQEIEGAGRRIDGARGEEPWWYGLEGVSGLDEVKDEDVTKVDRHVPVAGHVDGGLTGTTESEGEEHESNAALDQKVSTAPRLSWARDMRADGEETFHGAWCRDNRASRMVPLSHTTIRARR
jgi:hypothetical protein